MGRATSEEEKDIQAILAVEAYCRLENQSLVADELGITQPKVHRLIDRARKKGWISESPRMLRAEVPKGLYREAMERLVPTSQLEQLVRSIAPDPPGCRVSVVRGGDDFHREAADWLAERIVDSRRIGVTCGHTVFKSLDELGRRVTTPPQSPNDVRVFPLSGDPLQPGAARDPGFSSSVIAGRLSHILTGESTALCMSPVPAYMPRRFRSESEWFRNFVHGIGAYREIFLNGQCEIPSDETSQTPCVDTLDTLLTGIGISPHLAKHEDSKLSIFVEDRLQDPSVSPDAGAARTKQQIADEERYRDHLPKIILGDLAGILIEQRDISEKDKALVHQLNDEWFGLNEEHFRSCALRAANNGTLGVVVLCQGSSKAPLVMELIRRGLVNEFVISENLAKGMLHKERAA